MEKNHKRQPKKCQMWPQTKTKSLAGTLGAELGWRFGVPGLCDGPAPLFWRTARKSQVRWVTWDNQCVAELCSSPGSLTPTVFLPSAMCTKGWLLDHSVLCFVRGRSKIKSPLGPCSGKKSPLWREKEPLCCVCSVGFPVKFLLVGDVVSDLGRGWRRAAFALVSEGSGGPAACLVLPNKNLVEQLQRSTLYIVIGR